MKANCIGGCPCENYSCTETTPTPDVTTSSMPETTTSPTPNAVFVMNSYYDELVTMVVDFNGKNTIQINSVIFMLRQCQRRS